MSTGSTADGSAALPSSGVDRPSLFSSSYPVNFSPFSAVNQIGASGGVSSGVSSGDNAQILTQMANAEVRRQLEERVRASMVGTNVGAEVFHIGSPSDQTGSEFQSVRSRSTHSLSHPTTSPASFGPIGSPSISGNPIPAGAVSSPGLMSDVGSAGASFCAGVPSLPLISEFKEFVHLDKPSDTPYLKLLVTPPTQGSETESLKRIRKTYKYGLWRTPSEFLEEAMGTQHPVDSISVSSVTNSSIDFVVQNEPVDVAKYRLRTIIEIKRLQGDLADEDASIKKGMDIKLKERLQNKNIVLFRHLLKTTEYPDWEGVMNLLTEGVPPVGCDESPKGFDRQIVPATLTPEDLLKHHCGEGGLSWGLTRQLRRRTSIACSMYRTTKLRGAFWKGRFQKVECQLTLVSMSGS